MSTSVSDPTLRLATLERRVAIMTRTMVALVLAMVLLGTLAFRRGERRERFSEIDVERINVVERDGKLRLVISNRERSPAPLLRGKPYGGHSGGNRPGLISYNDDVTENGGFISSGTRNPDGTYSAEHSLTFDQFEQDQIIALQYVDANGRRRQGLQILDRTQRPIDQQDSAWKIVAGIPAGPARDSAVARTLREFGVAQRVYVGKDRSRTAAVVLGDAAGRTRLRLTVDADGAARIQFLDEGGKVVHEIAPPVRPTG